MGKLNLIQSHWTGQVGAYTGQRYKGRSVIKSNEHKKRHPNMAQTKSVRAFECLNRFASSCVGKLWKYTGLNDKKMLKHNALAADWKKLISEKKFSPENLTQIYKTSDMAVTPTFTVTWLESEFTVSWIIPAYDHTKEMLVSAVVDSRGDVLFLGQLPEGVTTQTLSTNYISEGDWVYGVSFLVDLTAEDYSGGRAISVIVGPYAYWEEGDYISITASISASGGILSVETSADAPSATFSYKWYEGGTLISTSETASPVYGDTEYSLEITATAPGYKRTVKIETWSDTGPVPTLTNRTIKPQQYVTVYYIEITQTGWSARADWYDANGTLLSENASSYYWNSTVSVPVRPVYARNVTATNGQGVIFRRDETFTFN